LAYIWSIVHDGHIAEDVLQDVSVLAVEKRSEIESAQVLPAWLRATARHRALYALRQASRAPMSLDQNVLDLLEGEWTQRDALPTNRLMDALRACLGKLSPTARQIVDMRYGQALGSQQIAHRLGRSLAAVYKTTTRAHTALAECVRRQMQHD
jgi:RNA polymerase sigma-70 factor (ECF subfamily)